MGTGRVRRGEKNKGYILQKNGGAEKHILERKKKAMIAMKQTWRENI